MSFLKAIIAGYIWFLLMIFIFQETDMKISNDIQLLSASIVIAGALASGDK